MGGVRTRQIVTPIFSEQNSKKGYGVPPDALRAKFRCFLVKTGGSISCVSVTPLLSIHQKPANITPSAIPTAPEGFQAVFWALRATQSHRTDRVPGTSAPSRSAEGGPRPPEAAELGIRAKQGPMQGAPTCCRPQNRGTHGQKGYSNVLLP